MNSSTMNRLIVAAKPGSWRDLTELAVAELVSLGLFDAAAWELTEAGRAALAEAGYRANGSRLERDWSTLATGGTFVSPPAAELDADQLADEAELAELLLQREAHAARLAAFDAERIVVGDEREACDVVGCVAAAAGRWDIVARPTSYRAIPLCRAHVAEHRAAPQVSAVRPTV